MVLYRAEEHRILELLRNLALERILPVTQRAARRKIGRKYRTQVGRHHLLITHVVHEFRVHDLRRKGC
jgi:hypothetical protein